MYIINYKFSVVNERKKISKTGQSFMFFSNFHFENSTIYIIKKIGCAKHIAHSIKHDKNRQKNNWNIHFINLNHEAKTLFKHKRIFRKNIFQTF